MLARDELSRDELSTSDNDQGRFEQLDPLDELSPRSHFEGTFGTFACALPLVVCRVSLVASQRW